MSDETIRFLINQKVSFINTAINVCMFWWVSSIIFSGSVFGAVWSNQESLLRQPGFITLLGLVLFVFFAAIAAFGFMVVYRLNIAQTEIATLATKLRCDDLVGNLNLKDKFFHAEISTFKIAMMIGSYSFAFVHIVWFTFWLYLMQLPIYVRVIGSVIGLVVWILWWWWWRKKLPSNPDDSAQLPPNKVCEPTTQ